jgi:hypothetical protein
VKTSKNEDKNTSTSTPTPRPTRALTSEPSSLRDFGMETRREGELQKGRAWSRARAWA